MAERTLLFTDIEGSARLWEESPEALGLALGRYEFLVRQAVAVHGGEVFKTAGDALYTVFATVPDAVATAIDAGRALLAEPWSTPRPLKVRTAIHLGEVEARGGDFFGSALSRTARLLALGHGGQTLLSAAAWSGLWSGLPNGVELAPLGELRLRGLADSETVFGLLAPGLPRTFPPLNPPEEDEEDEGPTNLPAPTTSFVGRTAELGEIARSLASASLVTLVGPGGTGKTRLALRAATDARTRFPGGVWLVELAPLDSPDLVAPTFVSVVGAEAVGRSALEVLTERLRARPTLVVLDNCEHLRDASAEIVQKIVRAIPTLRILATSREPLGIEEERIVRVPPLSPDEAVRLFAERAVAQRGDFVLTPHNAPVVGSLCARLDGIPFAVELAAARVRSLSVEQIEARLNDRFRLLTQGSRAALPRQQTLRALVEWSYDLLNDRERMVFRRLAVFVGGATSEAVATVVAQGDLGETEVAKRLASLGDKSLVSLVDGRYRMLETVHQYAEDRLRQSGEWDATVARHSELFADVAGQEGPRCREDGAAVRRLAADWDNLRAAMDRGTGSRRLDMAVALDPFWNVKGAFHEGFERCQSALRENASLPLDARRWGAAKAASWFALQVGELPAAEAWAAEGAQVAHALGDPGLEALSLGSLVVVLTESGELAQARVACERALALGEQAILWINLASVLVDSGEFGATERALDQAARLAYAQPNGYLLYLLDVGRGRLAFVRGSIDEAEAAFEAARSRGLQLEGAGLYLQTTVALADCQLTRGSPEKALALVRSVLREATTDPVRRDALFVQANAALAVGETVEARQALLDGLRTASPLHLLEALEAAARSLALAGRVQEATVLVNSAAAERRRRPMPIPPIRRAAYDALLATIGEYPSEHGPLALEAAKAYAIDALERLRA